MYNNQRKKFYYNPGIKTKIPQMVIFLNTSIGIITQWVTIAKDMYIAPRKIQRRQNGINKKPKVPINHFYHHYLHSNEEHLALLRKNQCTAEDLVAYTDGSRKEVINDAAGIYEYSGVGIYLRCRNVEYTFSQILGMQSILYNEQYALAI